MEYLLILAPVAFVLAIRNALSLDRHYTAVYDRLREIEAAEMEKTRQGKFTAGLTPGKSIPRRGPGQDQDLPEEPQWIRDWMDVMEGRAPEVLCESGSKDESGDETGDGASANTPGELRAAIVYRFPDGERNGDLHNAAGS